MAKKTDIMASVKKTASALKKSNKVIWKDFLFHSLLILAISVCLTLYAIKIFIAPIKQFIEATRKIAKGDFPKILTIDRTDEIGTLSNSFNFMTEKLKASEKLKEKYTEKLETDVALRTKELEDANNELNKIKDDLEELVEQKTIQLKKINEHLLTAGENERKSIASDLHDSVAQTLAFSIGQLKNMTDSDTPITKDMILEIKELLMQAISEIRLLIYQLRPPLLDDFEIDVALGYLIEGYKNNRLCKIKYVNNSDELLKTSQDIRLNLYRASNELISNILKHSKAKNACLELSNSEVEISIKIEDDGIGFDWNKIQKTKYVAVGLISISERIQNLGGKFEVVSIPDNGTKILVFVPCIHR